MHQLSNHVPWLLYLGKVTPVKKTLPINKIRGEKKKPSTYSISFKKKIYSPKAICKWLQQPQYTNFTQNDSACGSEVPVSLTLASPIAPCEDCTSYLFLCDDKIPDKKHLKGGRVSRGSRFQKACSPSWRGGRGSRSRKPLRALHPQLMASVGAASVIHPFRKAWPSKGATAFSTHVIWKLSAGAQEPVGDISHSNEKH